MEALAGVGGLTPWLLGARNLRSSFATRFMCRQFIICRTSLFLRSGLLFVASSEVMPGRRYGERSTGFKKLEGVSVVVGTKDEARPNGTATAVIKERKQTVKPQPITIESLALKSPPVEVVEWFHERGISANTLGQNQVRCINTTET